LGTVILSKSSVPLGGSGREASIRSLMTRKARRSGWKKVKGNTFETRSWNKECFQKKYSEDGKEKV